MSHSERVHLIEKAIIAADTHDRDYHTMAEASIATSDATLVDCPYISSKAFDYAWDKVENFVDNHIPISSEHIHELILTIFELQVKGQHDERD